MAQLWTDASFNEHTKEAGLGIIIKQMIKDGLKETRITLKKYTDDNNRAELLAIYYGIKHCPKDERLQIVTDSQVAIEAILKGNAKYNDLVVDIYQELGNRSFNLYHKKAHTTKQDRYSRTQEQTDFLAKQARKRKTR